MTSVNGENISTIGGGNPGNSPPQVEEKFPMRETVEVSLFPAELPKKVILSAKNEENPERFKRNAKKRENEGVSLCEKHPTY